MPGSVRIRLFDAHLHPDGLTEGDLETLQFFGVEAVLVPAYHAPSEPSPKSLRAHFDDIVERQLRRLERAGIRAYAALGVHPRAIPRRGLAEVLSALPEYFQGGRVVALGELGFFQGGEAEEDAVVQQLELARRLKLRVVIHTPHRHKEKLTRRLLVLIREAQLPPGRVLVDHADARTAPLILGCGHYAGLTIHPDELKAERAVTLVRKLGPDRLILNSDSGNGPSDIAALPRAARLLAKAKLSEAVIRRACSDNAAQFLRVEPLR